MKLWDFVRPLEHEVYFRGKLEAHVAAVEARQVNNLSGISVNTYLRIAKDLFLSTSFSITAVSRISSILVVLEACVC